jgi:hypothetical protein
MNLGVVIILIVVAFVLGFSVGVVIMNYYFENKDK